MRELIALAPGWPLFVALAALGALAWHNWRARPAAPVDLGRVQAIEIRPGDRLVLEIGVNLREEQRLAIRNHVLTTLPHVRGVLLLEGGVTLAGVMHEDAVAESHVASLDGFFVRGQRKDANARRVDGGL